MVIGTKPTKLPSCSVVIPTLGRVNLVDKLLTSLQKAAIHCQLTIEIIIIDDSPPTEQDAIRRICHRHGARYIRGPSNVREKRNLGIEESRGEVVLFIDSDCEVTSNVFNEHLKMYNKPNTAGVLGITEFTGKETTTWEIVRRTRFLDAFSFAKRLRNHIDSAPWGTCTNLSIKREILEEVGGFDASFPYKLGGDDVDLGIRINKAGYKIKMNPNAIVFHSRETWNNFWAVARRVFRWGRVDYYVFYEKHNDKVSLAFSKPTTIFFFSLFAGFVRVVMGNFLSALLLPFAWLLTFFFLISFFRIISLKEPLRNIFFEMPAQFLHFLFDFGTALESIRNKSLVSFFKAPLDDPRQVIILWNEKVREAWSMVLSIIVILLISMVI